MSVAEAAELLALPVGEVERLTQDIEPYWHANGSPRWPIRELVRVLGDIGPVVPRRARA